MIEPKPADLAKLDQARAEFREELRSIGGNGVEGFRSFIAAIRTNPATELRKLAGAIKRDEPGAQDALDVVMRAALFGFAAATIDILETTEPPTC